uniref:Acetolactate synthase small subunit n=1 Tax=uncultured Thiotrichaceae bacterium TaxID=298394 RepID=A0A6S6TUN3_9GAMM|nr:MAG: Acetolactate synthase small subunit (EC [uncultured Thiotrichaceae bacterium]
MSETPNQSVLRLTVKNHPGVMSHVCGLFTRRSYNLEGIMVRPLQRTKSEHSRMWLLVNEEDKLEQIISQTSKLVDVMDVEQHAVAGSVFEETDGFFGG